MQLPSTHLTKNAARAKRKVKENKWEKDEDEVGIDNHLDTTLAHPTPDLKEKEKGAHKKGTPTTPPAPLVIESPKTLAAIVVVKITPPALATKGKMMKRMIRINNHTNRQILTFKSMKQP